MAPSRSFRWDDLCDALESGRVDDVARELRLLPGIDEPLTDDGATALMIAVEEDPDCFSADVARLLLRSGADPLARDNAGRSALHYAAMGAGLAAIELLLSGIDEAVTVDSVVDRNGESPAALATRWRYGDEDAPAGADPLLELLRHGRGRRLR